MGGVYSSKMMTGVFSYQSSELDWCEDNYKYSEHVVEYFNTISNFFFFIMSPIMLYLLHPYARERSLSIHLVWTMMMFVGLFSAYFHMTLSFVGQMLDELSILWVLAAGYSMWFPRKLFPSFIKDRSTFSRLVLLVTVVTSLSSFIKPTANAYVLNCFGLHLLYTLFVEMRWFKTHGTVANLPGRGRKRNIDDKLKRRIVGIVSKEPRTTSKDIKGLFSAYFHMTLSFVGQMLDELSILWVLAAGYSMWFPRKLFPSFIKDRSTFSRLVLLVTVVTSLSSFIKPTANAYVLNCFGLHLLYTLFVEMRCCTDQKVLRLAKLSVVLWVLAISCWISDRFGCSFWQKLNFCYLHGIWHILIVMAVAYGSTLIAYLDAKYEIPHSLPGLQYWPCERWAVGLPHIVLKGTTRTRKQC